MLTTSKHQFQPVEDLSGVVEYKAVGCFADQTNHAMPGADTLGLGDYDNTHFQDRTHNISRCAEFAKLNGLRYFGIQNGGQCFTGPDAKSTYDKYGQANNCVNGTGNVLGDKSLANSVYKWVENPPEPTVQNPPNWHQPYDYIGCYQDYPEHAIKSPPQIDYDNTNYQILLDPISDCNNYAKKHGYSVFAIQDGGMCLTDDNALYNYDRYGPASTCTTKKGVDGYVGGKGTNSVYLTDISGTEYVSGNQKNKIKKSIWMNINVVYIIIIIIVLLLFCSLSSALYYNFKKK